MPLTAEERRLRHNESNKRWRAKNKEYIKEYNQQWLQKHPGYRRERYLLNREYELEVSRNYRRDHPDKIREFKRRYYSSCYLYPRRSWSKWEDMLILEHAATDTQLSQLIERSPYAIQTRRYELKKKLYQ